MSVFLKYKDLLVDYLDNSNEINLNFPLKKTGKILNNYTRGDFIVVGGRRTSGKGSFLLHNYVMHPLMQYRKIKKYSPDDKLKVIYFSTKRSIKSTIDRMIVNSTSISFGGNKISVSSLYDYSGAVYRISKQKSKEIVTNKTNFFNVLTQKGVLNVFGGKKSYYEIDNIIKSLFEEFGTFNADKTAFTYNEDSEHLMPIIVIDDAASIIGEGNTPCIKNDNAFKLGLLLKDLSKLLNALIVLGVPSSNVYSKKAIYNSTIEEISPYNYFADRIILLHNPLETQDNKVNGYDVNEFINLKTGVAYFRSGFIASNYMGPSGVYIPYFLYPENGFMEELPAPDNPNLDDYIDKVNKVKINKKEN